MIGSQDRSNREQDAPRFYVFLFQCFNSQVLNPSTSLCYIFTHMEMRLIPPHSPPLRLSAGAPVHHEKHQVAGLGRGGGVSGLCVNVT